MPVAELVERNTSRIRGGVERGRSEMEAGFDRRRSDRAGVCERALIACAGRGAFARLAGVEILDVSAEGFGVFSTEPMEAGEACTIFREHAIGGRREGVVARCSACEGGFIVGITTCDLRAA